MYNYIKNKLECYRLLKKPTDPPQGYKTEIKFTPNLTDNMVKIMEKCGLSDDITIRPMRAGSIDISVITAEGLTDSAAVMGAITKPLGSLGTNASAMDIYNLLELKTSANQNLSDVYDTDELFHYVMSGFSVVMIDGLEKGVAIGTQGYQFRSISEPESEMNMRGSREGFTEPIRVNLSMIRRRVKSPDMKFEMMQIGQTSRTDVCMVYLSEKVSPGIVDHVRNKLMGITVDILLESGYIQPFLESNSLNLFSDVGVTERPDSLAAKINEGRIAILVDGTPFALIVPYLFIENFQSLDDYAHKPYYSTAARFLKYTAFILTILLPGVYVAVCTFHPQIFPPEFLYNIINSEQTIHLPIIFEALVIHFLYEIMREAGLRLPRAVGHAVSIVGALILGDAAVNAGIVSAPMIMIVALTAISSFLVPKLYEPVSILKFVFIILGGLLGLYGIVLGIIFVLLQICSLSNFGIPYAAPISPFSYKAMRDVVIRAGWRKLSRQTAEIHRLNGVTNT
ncbi:MAG: spore germination protein [Oscillospiraceae bacterium]|nr:spore germination protein [Oscillospiraceae bacterium]